MLKSAEHLSNDPAVLKAMIATLQAENAKISATLRVHDQLVQALRLRIAKLQKLAFGKSSEKFEREIEQLELALEDLLVAVAEDDDAPIDEGQDEPASDEPTAPALRRRPRVSDATLRERRELDPGTCCPDCGGDLRVVGEDVSELLDMIAAQMKVVQIARIKKSCVRRGNRPLEDCLVRLTCERMVQEPAPSRPIPGSRWAARKGAPEGSWLARMLERKPKMLVAVALANRMARTAWALMRKGEDYRDPAMATA